MLKNGKLGPIMVNASEPLSMEIKFPRNELNHRAIPYKCGYLFKEDGITNCV